VPTVEKLEMREVLGFAAGAKVQLLLVPEGTPLMPPDAYNEVQELDHLPKRDEGGGGAAGSGHRGRGGQLGEALSRERRGGRVGEGRVTQVTQTAEGICLRISHICCRCSQRGT
jgi:hypothetical protein